MLRGTADFEDPEPIYTKPREPKQYTSHASLPEIDAQDAITTSEDAEIDVTEGFTVGPWGEDPHSSGTTAHATVPHDTEQYEDDVVDRDLISDAKDDGELDVTSGVDAVGKVPDYLPKLKARTRYPDQRSGFDAPMSEDAAVEQTHRFRLASAVSTAVPLTRKLVPDTEVDTLPTRAAGRVLARVPRNLAVTDQKIVNRRQTPLVEQEPMLPNIHQPKRYAVADGAPKQVRRINAPLEEHPPLVPTTHEQRIGGLSALPSRRLLSEPATVNPPIPPRVRISGPRNSTKASYSAGRLTDLESAQPGTTFIDLVRSQRRGTSEVGDNVGISLLPISDIGTVHHQQRRNNPLVSIADGTLPVQRQTLNLVAPMNISSAPPKRQIRGENASTNNSRYAVPLLSTVSSTRSSSDTPLVHLPMRRAADTTVSIQNSQQIPTNTEVGPVTMHMNTLLHPLPPLALLTPISSAAISTDMQDGQHGSTTMTNTRTAIQQTSSNATPVNTDAHNTGHHGHVCTNPAHHHGPAPPQIATQDANIASTNSQHVNTHANQRGIISNNTNSGVIPSAMTGEANQQVNTHANHRTVTFGSGTNAPPTSTGVQPPSAMRRTPHGVVHAGRLAPRLAPTIDAPASEHHTQTRRHISTAQSTLSFHGGEDIPTTDATSIPTVGRRTGATPIPSNAGRRATEMSDTGTAVRAPRSRLAQTIENRSSAAISEDSADVGTTTTAPRSRPSDVSRSGGRSGADGREDTLPSRPLMRSRLATTVTETQAGNIRPDTRDKTRPTTRHRDAIPEGEDKIAHRDIRATTTASDVRGLMQPRVLNFHSE